MNDCTNCDHAIYDPTFGEKRCRNFDHPIRDVDRYIDCVGHDTKPNNAEVRV